MSLWIILHGNKYKVSQNYKFYIVAVSVELSHLTITREEYKNQLENITNCIDDYAYCLRPSYTYPFIREQEFCLFASPHLLMRSVTSAMLYRITQNDNHLAELIGKKCWSHIFTESFCEVDCLTKYTLNRNISFIATKIDHSDVLARKESHYIFLTVNVHSKAESPDF